MRSSQPRAKSWRRKKQRNKSRLKQQAIRLISRKILRRTDKREKTHEADEEHSARPQIHYQKHRSGQPDPAQGLQHHRPARPPKHGRCVPHLPMPERLRHRLQVTARRQNSIGTNEPTNLKQQRKESRKVNAAKSAKKQPAWNQPVWRSTRSVEQPTDDGSRRPAHDDAIIGRDFSTQHVTVEVAYTFCFALASLVDSLLFSVISFLMPDTKAKASDCSRR